MNKNKLLLPVVSFALVTCSAISVSMIHNHKNSVETLKEDYNEAVKENNHLKMLNSELHLRSINQGKQIEELKKLNKEQKLKEIELNKKLKEKEVAKKKEEKQQHTLTVEATAYTAYCASGCTGVTRTGVDVSDTVYHKGYRVIAVDPSVIPLNSIVELQFNNGSTERAIAVDTGGAINGNRIDYLVSNKNKAWKFGRQDVKLTVLN
jgi:3D (Asp-Asp-Asp) domain-containing protein